MDRIIREPNDFNCSFRLLSDSITVRAIARSKRDAKLSIDSLSHAIVAAS